MILKSLSDLAATPRTLLDIGAGIGVLHHELLERGVGHAVHLEAAAAYVAAAELESARRGHEGRVVFRHGDFVSLASELGSAELEEQAAQATLPRIGAISIPGSHP